MSTMTCIEARVIAQSSITHNGGEKTGVTSLFRREKLVQPDGSVCEVPVVSGNSVRGQLRDVGMYHMISSLGYGIGEDGSIDGLSLAAFYLLFSGGRFASAASKETSKKRGIDLDTFRDIKKIIPLVNVFGGTIADRIMPGLLSVGKLIPICRETQHIVPESFHTATMPSFYDYVQEEMYVRTDDVKNDHYAALLTGQTRQILTDERHIKEERLSTGDTLQTDVGRHQQMRYYVETLAAGTQFYWRVVLKDTDDVSYDAFVVTLAEFSKNATLGGKSAVGHGLIKMMFGDWYTIRTEAVDPKAVDAPIGTRYLRHLHDNREYIRYALDAII